MDSLSQRAPRAAILEDRIRRILVDVLVLDPDSLGVDGQRAGLPEWDSLQHLNLVVALEQEFEIEITPDDFETMNSLAAIRSLVARKLDGGVQGV